MGGGGWGVGRGGRASGQGVEELRGVRSLPQSPKAAEHSPAKAQLPPWHNELETPDV